MRREESRAAGRRGGLARGGGDAKRRGEVTTGRIDLQKIREKMKRPRAGEIVAARVRRGRGGLRRRERRVVVRARVETPLGETPAGRRERRGVRLASVVAALGVSAVTAALTERGALTVAEAAPVLTLASEGSRRGEREGGWFPLTLGGGRGREAKVGGDAGGSRGDARVSRVGEVGEMHHRAVDRRVEEFAAVERRGGGAERHGALAEKRHNLRVVLSVGEGVRARRHQGVAPRVRDVRGGDRVPRESRERAREPRARRREVGGDQRLGLARGGAPRLQGRGSSQDNLRHATRAHRPDATRAVHAVLSVRACDVQRGVHRAGRGGSLPPGSRSRAL